MIDTGGMDADQRDWACWALRNRQRLSSLLPAQWEPVIRHARRADVLARIAAQLEDDGQLDSVEAAPRAHLLAASRVWRAQMQEVGHEARLIAGALRALDVPVVMLKGAAYVLADQPAAQGRLFSDIDILVPRAALPEVEGALRLNGWMGNLKDAYDQRYYREWMHELPPMTHVRRGTTLDVHHNILPITVRRPPDAELLLAQAVPLPGYPGLWVLSPADMVLHSMTHLFHNDDMSHGLRDLSDLDLLLRHYGGDTGFWQLLIDRAHQLHLALPLAYGLWATRELLGTPVPDDVLQQAEQASAGGQLPLMHWLWRRVLRTPHDDAALPGAGLAHFALYLRAHWLRMPPLLLARHLSIKAWKRMTKKGEELPAVPPPA